MNLKLDETFQWPTVFNDQKGVLSVIEVLRIDKSELIQSLQEFLNRDLCIKTEMALTRFNDKLNFTAFVEFVQSKEPDLIRRFEILLKEKLEELPFEKQQLVQKLSFIKAGIRRDEVSEQEFLEVSKDFLMENATAQEQYDYAFDYCAASLDRKFTWAQKAAERNCIDAQVYVGDHYHQEFKDHRHSVDCFRAIQWYSMAANSVSGNEEAKYKLKCILDTGVPCDHSTAVKNFKETSNAINATSAASPASAASATNNNSKQSLSDLEYKIGFYYSCGFGVEQDINKAMEWLTKSFDHGNVSACYEIGLILECNKIDDPNSEMAFKYFLKAAFLNLPEAQYKVGNCYLPGCHPGVEKDEQIAIEWITKAANQKNVNAQFCLATLTNDFKLDLMMSSAEQGHVESLYEVGQYYVRGLDESSIDAANYKAKAFEWCHKAANCGHASARIFVGQCYMQGITSVVEKNTQKAFEYYLKAAKQRHERGMLLVGCCYQDGTGVEKNEKESFEWFFKSCQAGSNHGTVLLGNCYERGCGVAKDEKKAIELFTKAANNNYPLAQNELGECYEGGHGVKQDETKAFELYLAAAESGYAVSQNKVGECYWFGLGVDRDVQKAKEWFAKAAAQDNKDAIASLNEIFDDEE